MTLTKVLQCNITMFCYNKLNENEAIRTYDILLFRIGNGPKDRGLFANCTIQPRTITHVAPRIRVTKNEYDNYMKYTILEHYLFNDKSNGHKLLALGYGSLLNHNKNPNIDYRIDSNNLCKIYSSGYNVINKDEELCISYGVKLWFNDADNDTVTSSDDSIINDEDAAKMLSRIELNDEDDNNTIQT